MDARVVSKDTNFDLNVLGHIDVREDKIGPGGSLGSVQHSHLSSQPAILRCSNEVPTGK